MTLQEAAVALTPSPNWPQVVAPYARDTVCRTCRGAVIMRVTWRSLQEDVQETRDTEVPPRGRARDGRLWHL